MTRNDRQRDIAQALNGADVALDSIEGPDGQGPYVPGVDFPGGSVGGNLDADTIASKERPVVDVTHPDFGAVGDGSTNDQPAIQAAIDHAASIAPASVYIPTGRYVIGDPSDSGSALRWTDDVILEGSGMFSTIIQDEFTQGGGTSTGEPRFIYAGGTDSTQGSRVGVRNLGIENYQGFDANTISLEEFNEGFVENVFIDNTSDVRDSGDSSPTGLPISLGFDEQAIVNRNGWVSGCILRNDVSANKTIEIAGVEGATITNNLCLNPEGSGSGISCVSVDGAQIAGNYVQSVSTSAPCYQVLGSRRVNISGNIGIGGQQGVTVGSGTADNRAFDVQQVVIDGNTFVGSDSHGVDIDNPGDVITITNNQILQAGGDGANLAINRRFKFNNNLVRQPAGHGFTNNNGSQEAREFQVNDNLIQNPGSAGIEVAYPNREGGTINNNVISFVADSSGGILITNPNANTPNSYTIVGNALSESTGGIVENGTPTNTAVTGNVT